MCWRAAGNRADIRALRANAVRGLQRGLLGEAIPASERRDVERQERWAAIAQLFPGHLPQPTPRTRGHRPNQLDRSVG